MHNLRFRSISDAARVKVLAWTMLAALSASADPPAAAYQVSPLPDAVLQERGFWCWAAVDQMLLQHFTFNRLQCDIADDVLNRGNCCADKLNCNETSFPNLARLGFPSITTAYLNTFAGVQAELWNNVHPFIFSWVWTGQSESQQSHFILATGYGKIGPDDVVYRNDPMGNGGSAFITFADFVGNSASATGPQPNVACAGSDDHCLGTMYTRIK